MKLFFIFISLLLASCAYNPKNLTPHFVDPDLNITRQYHVTETNPEIVFAYTQDNNISDAVKKNGGLLCLPVPQALEVKRAYESYVRSKSKNAQTPLKEFSLKLKPYPKTVEEELEIIDGIPNTFYQDNDVPREPGG